MRLSQKILCLNFVLSYTAETSVTCLALNLLIKTLGADRLGKYFAISAAISIALVLLSVFASKKISALSRFIFVHTSLAILAISCIVINSTPIQARIIFIAAMGFNLMIYFSNWSITSMFITPFESKRLFPIVSASGQIGVFLGSLFAMAKPLGLTIYHYFITWLIIKFLMISIGLFLRTQFGKKQKYKSESITARQEIGFLQLFRHYRLVPRLTLWIFIWGIIFTSIITMAGGTFDKSGINLTLLYGILSLASAVIASLFASVIYPKVLKLFKLGNILVISSIIAFISGGTYLLSNIFIIALIVYTLYMVLDGGVITLTLSTEFGLYPANRRDRIRLVAEILANSAGAVCIGFIFALPKALIPWTIAVLFLTVLIIAFLSRQGYIREVLQFLNSRDQEEQVNAIALFDMLDNKEGYSKIIDILVNGNQVPLRLSVLNTFASLGSIKPAPDIIELLKTSTIDPLRIGILHYFGNIEIKRLDPFLQYQLFDTLQEICRSHASNTLRAMAIKIWVQYGPLDKTVGFIMEALRDKDNRVVANAIDGLNYINYPGIVHILLPYLKHEVPRIRANCIVTLWKYPEARDQVQDALNELLHSDNIGYIISGVWTAGEVKDTSQAEYLKGMLSRQDKEIQRNVPIALLKLGKGEYYMKVVEMILGDDEKQAMNMCYLSLRLGKRILNEQIISTIYEIGEDKRSLAIQRYSQCGGFCREQLELLSGKTEQLLI